MLLLSRADLVELIAAGENSYVDFKRDDIRPDSLAKVLVGFLNHDGGHVLLGVEDDGRVSGLAENAKKTEEWVMEVCRTHVQPAVVPSWQVIAWDRATMVGMVSVPGDAPDKPYKAKRGASWVTRVRVGTVTRDATRFEEQRLYQSSGHHRYGAKPAVGSEWSDLDRRRLVNYFADVLDGDVPEQDDEASWLSLLANMDLVVAGRLAPAAATVDGVLLFGTRPSRWVQQAGIRAICLPGEELDYATRDDQPLGGPMVPLLAKDGTVKEPGLIDKALDFIRRNTEPTARLEGGRRIEGWQYPLAVIREAVVNAVVHRDYSIVGSDVELLVFSNRVEVRSPGALPNTVTTEGMRRGMRYARDQVLVNVMRDYGYVDARGMGIRNKIIPGMRAHNGTEPDLIEEDNRFIVRLWKDAPAK